MGTTYTVNFHDDTRTAKSGVEYNTNALVLEQVDDDQSVRISSKEAVTEDSQFMWASIPNEPTTLRAVAFVLEQMANKVEEKIKASLLG